MVLVPHTIPFLFSCEVIYAISLRKPSLQKPQYGTTYYCEHPVYCSCTLFRIGNRGLVVIQQCYEPDTKHTYWTEIDSWLTGELYLHPKFKSYFDKRADVCKEGLYPTVTIRQIMWALKLKPRERWETCFDRREI